MGQPPHGPHGPQHQQTPHVPQHPPFPGQPGHRPAPGQLLPQGPPPQGPPPGYGPQGPGPGAPRRNRTGLVIGAAVGAAVLVIIGGTLISVNSGGDYLALPNDCSAVIGEDVLADVFDGSVPGLEGRYETDSPEFGHSDVDLRGVLACTASTGGVELAATVALVDRGDSGEEEAMDRYFELEGGDVAEMESNGIPPGEATEHSFGMEDGTALILWDEPSIGDRSVVIGMSDESETGYMMTAGVATVRQENAIVGLVVDYSGSPAAPEVEEIYQTVEAGAGALSGQIPRVAER